MIPWQCFENRIYSEWQCPRVDLRDHWLWFVPNGPSMADFVFNSPMLELAHERRFVVTEQGWSNATFEDEHTERIDTCLAMLAESFTSCTTLEDDCSTPAPDVDHVGLWTREAPVEAPAPTLLSISCPSTMNSTPPGAPLATVESVPHPREARGCLAPGRARTPAVPSLILEDSELSDELSEETLRSFSVTYKNGHTPYPKSGRTHKIARQRRCGDARLGGRVSKQHSGCFVSDRTKAMSDHGVSFTSNDDTEQSLYPCGLSSNAARDGFSGSFPATTSNYHLTLDHP